MSKVYTLLFLLLFMGSSLFIACSDDDLEGVEELPQEDSEEQGNSGQEGNHDMISPEALKKIEDIYGKASIEPQRVTTVHQLAILTSICSKRKEGPISVTSALLNGDRVTLLTLGGTSSVEGQATTMEESQLASFGKNNDYLKAVVGLFKDGTIPEDFPVVVTGISLGGMIAQQLLGENLIMERFNLCSIITFGSPITLPLDRKGVQLVRFVDAHDKVPQLGESMLRMGLVGVPGLTKGEVKKKMDELDQKERVLRTGKYTEIVETHALSYIEDECWLDVDFLGDYQKKNILELTQKMKFYAAPKIEKE